MVNIRELKGKDLRVLSPIVARILKDVDFQGMDREEAGRKILSMIFEKELDNVWGWIADIAQISTDELDNLPLPDVFDIVKSVYEKNKGSFFLAV